MDLVNPNIRGAVLSLSPYVSPVDMYMSWARHGFFHPEYRNPSDIKSNPGLYDSMGIFSSLSQRVDWSDQEQASRGLRSLSQIIRMASTNEFSDEYEFNLKISDIRTACQEDGFEFKENPYTITHGDAIPLDELKLDGLSTTEGIYRKIKQLNRALVRDRDNLEVIGFSKDLMEATADAVLQELGHPEELVRKMQAAERCSNAMSEVGIVVDNGTGKISQGLTGIRKAMNKIVEGTSEMRREDTDEGHGMAGLRAASDSQANLALSSALLWCHYLLDRFNEKRAAPF